MKAYPILIFSTLLVSSLAASADVAIRDILLRQKGKDTNVRVIVGNSDTRLQKGPIALTLYIRPDDSADWRKVKVWNDISSIKPDDKVSRDLFSENSRMLRDVAANPAWQARAIISAPNGKRDEKTVVQGGN